MEVVVRMDPLTGFFIWGVLLWFGWKLFFGKGRWDDV